MKNKLLVLIVAFWILGVSNFAYAQNHAGNTGNSNGNTSSGNGGSNSGNSSAPKLPVNGTPCNFDSTQSQLCNPIKAGDLKEVFVQIISYILGIIALASVVMIVVSGFRMVVSGGSEGAVKGAKTQLTWAILGLLLATFAYSIVAIIQNVVKGT
jgi:hypothetical protein